MFDQSREDRRVQIDVRTQVLCGVGIILLFALLLLALGCGTGSKVIPAVASNATISTGDATNDQILKFELNVSAITLTGAGGTATTGNLLSGPEEVEFVHEAGTMEPLTLATIPPGTYSGATLSVSNPEVVVINAGTPTKIPSTLSSSTVTVTFASNLTVGSTPLFLNFDLDLVNSVTLNGAPPTSATVSPKFNVTSATVPASEGDEDVENGEIEDAQGTITNITAPNFTIRTSQSSITFATNSSTQFVDGVSSLSQLKVGEIVEVDGVTQPDGTKLATKVELEEDLNGEEIEGVVSAVTGSPATQITISQQDDTSGSANAPVTADVSIGATTQFVVRPDKLSLGSAPAFDASHIGKGQAVEVDTSNAAVTPVLADKIRLREEALIGTVSNATSSGFTLTITATSVFGSLSGQTAVPVTIVSGTQQRVTPANGGTVRVRGLIFFNPAGTPQYTMVASRIDANN